MIKKLLVLSLMMFSSVSAINLSERMYINDEDLDYHQDSFKIHVGNNVWIETETIHRDETGLYTFENNIVPLIENTRDGVRAEYKKRWKCPYCYQYWPLGTACQNKDCPSKYK